MLYLILPHPQNVLKSHRWHPVLIDHVCPLSLPGMPSRSHPSHTTPVRGVHVDPQAASQAFSYHNTDSAEVRTSPPNCPLSGPPSVAAGEKTWHWLFSLLRNLLWPLGSQFVCNVLISLFQQRMGYPLQQSQWVMLLINCSDKKWTRNIEVGGSSFPWSYIANCNS